MLPSGVRLGDSTAQTVSSSMEERDALDGNLGAENIATLLQKDKHSCPALLIAVEASSHGSSGPPLTVFHTSQNTRLTQGLSRKETPHAWLRGGN